MKYLESVFISSSGSFPRISPGTVHAPGTYQRGIISVVAAIKIAEA